MSYGGEGVARMRVLQVVVLIVFGVIAARLAYIQLIDSKYEARMAADPVVPAVTDAVAPRLKLPWKKAPSSLTRLC